eukprot:jgi/Ulvmu1/10046/UM059_0096.1
MQTKTSMKLSRLSVRSGSLRRCVPVYISLSRCEHSGLHHRLHRSCQRAIVATRQLSIVAGAIFGDQSSHLNRWYGILAALCVSLCPSNAAAIDQVLGALPAAENYAAQVSRRQSLAQTSRNDPHATLLDESEDMFTQDAWLGMKRLVQYGQYVDTLCDVEQAPGCENCRKNREVLEHAWQVVANEFFDPYDRFSQGQWAGELERALRSADGALHTKHELYATAKRMIATLGDQYSEYLDPAAFRAAIKRPTRAERDYLAQQAVGVGMKLGDVSRGTGRVVAATLSGSAAEAAGLRIGDVVLSVDGTPAARLAVNSVKSYLRGPEGSAVDLEVHRAASTGALKRERLTLLRQALPQVAAARTVIQDPTDPSKVAQYIRLNYFSSDATKQVMQAIMEGETLGVDGYILDLRNNPGGVFEEAIAIASYFLDSDADSTTPSPHIVETVRNVDPVSHRNVIDNVWSVGTLPSEVFPRHAWGLTNRPMAVITNNGSASASEVLAGALQDNQRATILGEKTFGKGVVQYYFGMEDGSGIKLTVAKYLTPNYRDIALEGGIEPDLACRDHPRGILPTSGGELDGCIQKSLKHLNSSEGVPAVGLQASR